ncbi:MAG TPA: SDR family oxidoreductase [Acidimicrobiales bacterium]|nr:SDR family oxidoreductase [Acidimicrobiales bacterium]
MVLDRMAATLDGTVAVVTGGGAGIGRGVAAGLAAFGARVAIWERDAATAGAAAAEVGGLACVTDVRVEAEVDAALARTVGELGLPTVLVNNAGGVFWSPLLETAPKGWDALVRANLGQVLLCTQRVARALVDAGAGGSIVNVASIEGTRAAPGFAAYAAAKAGVINFTRTAALELAPHGIRVNCLAPDATDTEGLRAVAPGAGADGFAARAGQVAAMVPMGRIGHVDEMAGAAVFLASALSSYVTGQTIHVDGGTAAAGGWYHDPGDGHYVLGPSGAAPAGAG